MPLDPHRILVVEDDPIDRAMISASLSASGFDVTSTDSALSASQLIGELQPSAILLDIALPYRSGATWLADSRPTSAPPTSRSSSSRPSPRCCPPNGALWLPPSSLGLPGRARWLG